MPTDDTHNSRRCSFFACNVGGDCPFVANPKYAPTDDTELSNVLQSFRKAVLSASLNIDRQGVKKLDFAEREALARLSEYVTRKEREAREDEVRGVDLLMKATEKEARIDELKNIAFSHLSDEMKDFIYDEYTKPRLEQLQGKEKDNGKIS